jgi:predicted secreted protein
MISRLVRHDTLWPLGNSTGCKISDSSETGDRVTKEVTTGKWKEKYVKSLAESIQADGFVYDGDDAANKANLPTLKELWMTGQPITARYAYRGEEQTKYYQGDYVITSLENDGQAGDDEKYSLTLENSGAITSHAPAGGNG